MDQLAVEKPTLSNKAWKRFSGKHKGRIKTESGGSEMLEGDGCIDWFRIVYSLFTFVVVNLLAVDTTTIHYYLIFL